MVLDDDETAELTRSEDDLSLVSAARVDRHHDRRDVQRGHRLGHARARGLHASNAGAGAQSRSRRDRRRLDGNPRSEVVRSRWAAAGWSTTACTAVTGRLVRRPAARTTSSELTLTGERARMTSTTACTRSLPLADDFPLTLARSHGAELRAPARSRTTGADDRRPS